MNQLAIMNSKFNEKKVKKNLTYDVKILKHLFI